MKDEELLKQFYDDLIEVYGLEATWGTNKSGITGKDIKLVRLRAKLAFDDLLTYATYFSKDWIIKPKFLKSSKTIQKEFLKAFYDDEGSIKSKSEICLYSINENGLLQVQEMLRNFNINTRLSKGFGARRNVFGLITRDFRLFKQEIGFNLKRKQDKLVKIIELRT